MVSADRRHGVRRVVTRRPARRHPVRVLSGLSAADPRDGGDDPARAGDRGHPDLHGPVRPRAVPDPRVRRASCSCPARRDWRRSCCSAARRRASCSRRSTPRARSCSCSPPPCWRCGGGATCGPASPRRCCRGSAPTASCSSCSRWRGRCATPAGGRCSDRGPSPGPMLTIVLAPLGLVAFWWYCFATTGDAFAQATSIAHGWGWAPDWPWSNLRRHLRGNSTERFWAWGSLLYFGASLLLLRFRLYEEFAFCLACFLLFWTSVLPQLARPLRAGAVPHLHRTGSRDGGAAAGAGVAGGRARGAERVPDGRVRASSGASRSDGRDARVVVPGTALPAPHGERPRAALRSGGLHPGGGDRRVRSRLVPVSQAARASTSSWQRRQREAPIVPVWTPRFPGRGRRPAHSPAGPARSRPAPGAPGRSRRWRLRLPGRPAGDVVLTATRGRVRRPP